MAALHKLGHVDFGDKRIGDFVATAQIARIGSADDGLVKLHAKIVDAAEICLSPDTGQPCVYYRTYKRVVNHWSGHDHAPSFNWDAWGTEITIDDGTGEATVSLQPPAASVSVKQDWNLSRGFIRNEESSEASLIVGDDVIVVGEIRTRSDGTREVAPSNESDLAGRGARLIVSNYSTEALAELHRQNYYMSLGTSAVFAAVVILPFILLALLLPTRPFARASDWVWLHSIGLNVAISWLVVSVFILWHLIRSAPKAFDSGEVHDVDLQSCPNCGHPLDPTGGACSKCKCHDFFQRRSPPRRVKWFLKPGTHALIQRMATFPLGLLFGLGVCLAVLMSFSVFFKRPYPMLAINIWLLTMVAVPWGMQALLWALARFWTGVRCRQCGAPMAPGLRLQADGHPSLFGQPKKLYIYHCPSCNEMIPARFNSSSTLV